MITQSPFVHPLIDQVSAMGRNAAKHGIQMPALDPDFMKMMHRYDQATPGSIAIRQKMVSAWLNGHVQN